MDFYKRKKNVKFLHHRNFIVDESQKSRRVGVLSFWLMREWRGKLGVKIIRGEGKKQTEGKEKGNLASYVFFPDFCFGENTRKQIIGE